MRWSLPPSIKRSRRAARFPDSSFTETVAVSSAAVSGTRRRAQTEGRIGVLKNVFLQRGVPRAKGFANRELQAAWAVLSHNLWVVARMPWVTQASET